MSRHEEAELQFKALADRWFPDQNARVEAARRLVDDIRHLLPEPKHRRAGAISANVDREPIRCTGTIHCTGVDDEPDSWIYEATLGPARAFFKSSGAHVQVGADPQRLQSVAGLKYDVATPGYANGVEVVVAQLIAILDAQLQASPPPKRQAAAEF